MNPARSVRQRAEGSGRLRYLSDDEYDRLHKVVAEKFPQHLSELIVSLQTGMRLTEQYTLTWGQVHFDLKAIELTKAKNGSARTVHLNSEVISTLQSLKAPNRLKSDLVFPRLGTEGRFDTRSWFVPCLAAATHSSTVGASSWPTWRRITESPRPLRGGTLPQPAG